MPDNNPQMEYCDDDGRLHVMAACGHYVSGAVKTGDKIALCPNCQFLIKFKDITIPYPEQLPELHMNNKMLDTQS